MASTAGVLNILVTASTAAANAALAKTSAQLTTTAASANATTAATTKASAGMTTMGKAAKFGAGVGIAALAVALKKSVDEAREAQKATAQTKAVLKSMGNAAGVTTTHVEKLANKISVVSGVDDELVQSSENVMLTFGLVRNEMGKGNKVFNRSIQVVADLSARFDQDLAMSTKQVGKALNDPIAGLGALSRVGVQFTEQQKEQIEVLVESGNQLKAQKIVLGELEKQTKGAAAAEADPWDKLNVALENLAETVGTALLPTFSHWANLLAKFLHQMNTGKKAGGDFQKALKTIGDVLAFLWPLMMAFYKYLIKLGKALVDIGKFGIKAFNSIKGAAKDVWDWFRGAWQSIGDFLSKPFKGAANTIIGFINAIIDAINFLPGIDDIGHVGSVGGGPSGQKKQAKVKGGGRQLGGLASIVPGYGSGDKVHMQAMVEPGEGIFVMNRNAMGALQAMNDAEPRFARGGSIPHMDLGGLLGKTPAGKVVSGAISGAGDIIGKLPSPGDLPDWMAGLGTWVIDQVKEFIKDKAGGILGFGGGGSPSIVMVGRILQNAGYQVGEHPAFGGVSAVHVPGSAHYSGRAIDVNHGGNEMAALDLAAKALMRINHSQIIWRNHDLDTGAPIGGHMDHLHFAMQRGGVLRTPKLGNKWIGKTAGGTWDADEAFTLLRQVGASREVAKQLSAKVMGESSGNPHAIGHDPGGTTGYGLWQITSGYNDDLIRKYGGPRGVMRPVANAMAALEVYGRGGIGQWYAPSGRPGSLLWDRINVARKAVKKPKKPKKGKGKPGGGGGGGDTEVADDPFAAINEMIGEQNLLRLQNYNLGMAQHPLLGIANPAMPGMSPLLSAAASGQTAMNVSAAKPSVHSPKIGGPRVTGGLKSTGVTIVIEDGAVNANRIKALSGKEAKRHLKRAARRGNRRLPSGGGGGP